MYLQNIIFQSFLIIKLIPMEKSANCQEKQTI